MRLWTISKLLSTVSSLSRTSSRTGRVWDILWNTSLNVSVDTPVSISIFHFNPVIIINLRYLHLFWLMTKCVYVLIIPTAILFILSIAKCIWNYYSINLCTAIGRSSPWSILTCMCCCLTSEAHFSEMFGLPHLLQVFPWAGHKQTWKIKRVATYLRVSHIFVYIL